MTSGELKKGFFRTYDGIDVEYTESEYGEVRILANDRVVEIDQLFMKSLPDMTEFYVPDTVKLIDARAFAYCDKIKRIYIPKSVTRINEMILDCHYSEDAVEIYYDGDAESFRKISEPRIEYIERHVEGAYDKYPYYISAGSHDYTEKLTHYFDLGCRYIDVRTSDGEVLKYGFARHVN